jgi:hypothetical protein
MLQLVLRAPTRSVPTGMPATLPAALPLADWHRQPRTPSHRGRSGPAFLDCPSVACLGERPVSICVAIWLALFFEYHVSPRLKVVGFPIPVVAFALEKTSDGGEQWTDFVSPVPEFYAISNVLLFAMISVYPVWAANTLVRRRRRGFRHAARDRGKLRVYL